MSQLFTPVKFGPLTLVNRIVIAPMCQYSAIDGQASQWHSLHLGRLALSGAALVIIEATAVNPKGRISYADLGLWDDKTQAALAQTLANIRPYSNSLLGIQLAHAGRKASTDKPWHGGGVIGPQSDKGWQAMAPSAIAFDDSRPTPQAMTIEEIKEVVADFVASAKRAVNLGLDAIELHAAHGYLLHQFLSPLSNQRDDSYGGSLENRMRLVLEVFTAMRSVVPSTVALGVRISATDWVDGGWDLEQSLVLAHELERLGCDFLHVSSGGLSVKQVIPAEPSYQVPFAAALTQQLTMSVIAVGLITEAEQAEAVISSNSADAVALARGILYNPHWVWHAAEKLNAEVAIPAQYLRSAPHGSQGRFIPMVLNDN
jgi:2,4-dienoyl-CoA reductase-like NADH-dependent reductase (Old Yellow Enzyme family)